MYLLQLIQEFLTYIKNFREYNYNWHALPGVQFLEWKICEPIHVFLWEHKLIETRPLSRAVIEDFTDAELKNMLAELSEMFDDKPIKK